MKTGTRAQELSSQLMRVLLPLPLFLACASCGGKEEPDVLLLPDRTAPVTTAIPGEGAYNAIQYVTLTTGEAATVYYSVDGNDPAQGASNTVSGASPYFWVRIGEGSTVLKYFAVDAEGNAETVRTASYAVIMDPRADAGPDRNVWAATTVTLDGSGSTSKSGAALSYEWTLISRPEGSSASLSGATAVMPTFMPDRQGVYVASLVVNDGTTSSAPDTTVITAAMVQSTFDDGALGIWTTNGAWGVTTQYSYSGGRSVTDSPGGNYANNSDTYLLSPVLDLTQTGNARLSFYHRYRIESYYDRATVEISTNGGSTFTVLRTYDGTLSSFSLVTIDLTPYKTSQVVIRFRLRADYMVVYDGWYIDDIRIDP